ncbi:zinc-dependent alcohol dehydrogenase family protein [Pseudoxanthomonas sp. F37]|uniref:zinc-dependent alcohol dehydrogenase family protein n=1 Tax=Pseudoxanthomonas sp. F37 TaxID=2932492 RepID=UPI001FD05C26|nr:zinc-dependent alcohol dehydrogenase family protein [Pseudoxanthomonas sp. F37]UOV07115.1 zinc-dependent alcohol dehydrogenase family protein [Pseudoxanthomonas sp. F37]
MKAHFSPITMKAALLVNGGEPLQLTDVPIPELSPGHVKVRVAAAGLNPLDTKIRAGKASHAQHPLPAVLGIDLAGTVEAIAEDVTTFALGDTVFGMTGGVGGVQGALAQFAIVDAALLANAPSSFSAREAAAIPLVFITAWEGLVDRAGVKSGQRVLIHGGAGGVGHVAVQIAHAFGAQVFATGNDTQRDYIESLGATFIDYRAQAVDDYVAQHTGGEGFDIIFDTVGGTTLDDSFRAARRYHGHVVSALGWGTHSLAPLSFRAATYSGVFTLLPLITGRDRAHHGYIMKQAERLANEGKLTIRLDPHVFGLSAVEEAYQFLESGDAQGKVVVDVQ